MEDKERVLKFISQVIDHVPADWIDLTTHRLDIYNEDRAKVEFLSGLDQCYKENKADTESLAALPTAYDYIRLGHPLSSVLEWTIASLNNLSAESVISFSSRTMPLMAVLRTNALSGVKTRIAYSGQLPAAFDVETIHRIYGYAFDLQDIKSPEELEPIDGCTLFFAEEEKLGSASLHPHLDFYVAVHRQLGSIILVNGAENSSAIGAIQHVRRRESIAMTPANCLSALKLITNTGTVPTVTNYKQAKDSVIKSIKSITASEITPVLGSSGLSVQYAIMMGLVEHARQNHPGKAIRFLVPPNCYGGTNDQARRVAASIDDVEVLDLPVDGDNNMVDSIDSVLNEVAQEDAVPYIIAEIPTNPRVEVPDLQALRESLSKDRITPLGTVAIDPVFILDQTFCPNIQFLSEDGILANIRTISYVSGSKFPSGGRCTAGYCVANEAAAELIAPINKHLQLCDNKATPLQVAILAEQLPSMNARIKAAYKNTREFVQFIEHELPTAKINFVSKELAEQGFTPSVFSLDLPTKGDTHEKREEYKRELNHRLIHSMITQIPNESKYCVSYGQLKGCYWTIPATSTQGTTKEEDKDYIARVSLSPQVDLEKHKTVFKDFVATLKQ